jgi:hypothetical protein
MTFRTLTARLKSMSPYSQSTFFTSEKKEKETHAAFEERCWRERMHLNSKGEVIIPAMSLKYSIDEACKRLALQVPGEGKTRYTKFFEAGYMIPAPPSLGIKGADVEGEWLWMSSTGRKGKDGGTRVRRCYPTIPKWEADVEFVILDEKIPEEVFEKCLESAGTFVGIGRFRPENQGYYGRFLIESKKWS